MVSIRKRIRKSIVIKREENQDLGSIFFMECYATMTIYNPSLLSPEQDAEEGDEARGDLAQVDGRGALPNLSAWK